MSERETRADAEHWQAALRLYEALLDLPAEARAEALSCADAAPEARERAARMLAADGQPSVLDVPLGNVPAGDTGPPTWSAGAWDVGC